DRKLLIFADNRQDAAHQAGYTADKHRTCALRHAMAYEIQAAGARGVYLRAGRCADHRGWVCH
ncbi:MAG: hypothetical protein ACUVR8_12390, partial [Acidobacteriota bacterium]